MNANAAIAHIQRQTQAIRAVTAELKADNDAAERNERHIAHANLERELRRYMTSHKSYGNAGVCNLLSVISQLCGEIGDEQVREAEEQGYRHWEDSDWFKAQELIDTASEACDLKYAGPRLLTALDIANQREDEAYDRARDKGEIA